MPPLESEVLTLMAAVATVLVQLVKGLLSEEAKDWIPLVLFVICTAVGTGLAFYYGRDPVAGALEGFFGFAGAVGFYEVANVIPGANSVMNDEGWVRRE